MKKPEWYGGILNLSAALYDYYGLPNSRKPDELLSKWLKDHKFRCVAAVLLDAMGVSILERSVSENGFFRSHLVKSVTTVFPPTTTAATTAFLTNRSPMENAWLGWNQYFKEKDDQIILFREHSQYTAEEYPGFIREALPVSWIMDELNANGIKADSVWPAFVQSWPSHDFEEFCSNVLEAVSDPECRFVYGYWDQPDGWLHEHGPSEPGLSGYISAMEQQIEKLAESLPEDCGMMVIADHSQIDIRHYAMEEDGELSACFASRPSLEARCVSFRIKEGEKERFETLFRERFGDQFTLLNHGEAVACGLFGSGAAHERFEDFVGDYIAIAETPLQLEYIKGHNDRGNHAGGMEEEAVIPLILFPRL
jgi:hypothetical protein